MKTIRIVADNLHGRDTKVYDGEGNDISRFVSKAVVTLDCQGLNSATLDVLATADVVAELRGLNVTQTCPRCLASDRHAYELEQRAKAVLK